MKVFKFIVAAWKLFQWLREQKKAMESNVEGYLSAHRAYQWRLALERMFYCLSEGKDIENMPAVVQWFFDRTVADNRIGWFGLRLLKSEKITRKDDRVKSYPAH